MLLAAQLWKYTENQLITHFKWVTYGMQTVSQ